MESMQINVLNIINFFLLCLIGIAGFIQLWDFYFGNFPWYSKNKTLKRRKEIQYIINRTFEKDYKMLVDYEEERVKLLCVQWGLKTEDFQDVKLQILRFRRLPMKTSDQIRKKMIEILTINNRTLIDQRYSATRIYNKVDFYINLTDIMYSDEVREELATMMISQIHENFSEDNLSDNNKGKVRIIVPTDGNLLLGIEVSKRLHLPVVKMRNEERVTRGQFWDGILEPNSRVIIIHDVLVTAKQIVDSIRKLPNNTQVMGVFCLVQRTDTIGKKILHDKGHKSWFLIELDDKQLEQIVKQKNGELYE